MKNENNTDKMKYGIIILLLLILACFLGGTIIVPAIFAAQKAAYSMACKSRVKQLYCYVLIQNKQGYLELPFYGSWDESTEFWSWRIALIKHEKSFREIFLSEPWNSEHNLPLIEQMDYAKDFTCTAQVTHRN